MRADTSERAIVEAVAKAEGVSIAQLIRGIVLPECRERVVRLAGAGPES